MSSDGGSIVTHPAAPTLLWRRATLAVGVAALVSAAWLFIVPDASRRLPFLLASLAAAAAAVVARSAARPEARSSWNALLIACLSAGSPIGR